MFQRLVTGAVFAGCAAGLIAALLHFSFVQGLILTGEQYESGALTHFAAGGGHMAHDGADAASDAEAGHDHATHDHSSDGHSVGGLSRDGLTVLFTVLIYVAYGFILMAGFGAASVLGVRIGAVQGLLWGIGGFAVFQLAPAMGLAPELPGSVGPDLGARQVWWWSTAALTAAGLLGLGYGRKVWVFALAGAALALPHVIGAPALDGYFGVAPPELAAAFSARVLGVGLVVWSVLGWVAGSVWARGEAV